eukprot:1157618-Pelagomonas_calceolata.AAC.6
MERPVSRLSSRRQWSHDGDVASFASYFQSLSASDGHVGRPESRRQPRGTFRTVSRASDDAVGATWTVSAIAVKAVVGA